VLVILFAGRAEGILGYSATRSRSPAALADTVRPAEETVRAPSLRTLAFDAGLTWTTEGRLGGTDDRRLTPEAAPEAALAEAWALRASYLVQRDDQPQAGFEATDTSTAVSLVRKH
jgi:hypothetical protein